VHKLCKCYVVQIGDAQSKLELKKKEIEKLLEKEKIFLQSFLESVADNKFSEYLTKVYKKKIKRSKKAAAETQGIIITLIKMYVSVSVCMFSVSFSGVGICPRTLERRQTIIVSIYNIECAFKLRGSL